MSKEKVKIPVILPLDSDGFLRRECPNCAEQFKWNPKRESVTGDEAEHHFCPICGMPSESNAWTTPAQKESMLAQAAPEIGQHLQSLLSDRFSGRKRRCPKPSRGPSAADSKIGALTEPEDMSIVRPPCHRDDTFKVESTNALAIYCLVCGLPFTV